MGLFGWFGKKKGMPEDRVIKIPADRIIANPFQPRRTFQREALERLKESIKNYGVVVPILVRPGEEPDQFELVCGERRWRACRELGITEVPAILRDMDDGTLMAFALIENVVRESLSANEEAEGVQRLEHEHKGEGAVAAARLGITGERRSQLAQVTAMPAILKEAISARFITEQHALMLRSIPDEKTQLDWVARIYSEQIPASDLSARLKEELGREIPFVLFQEDDREAPDQKPDEPAGPTSLAAML